jgi:molecular chaperone GrpE
MDEQSQNDNQWPDLNEEQLREALNLVTKQSQEHMDGWQRARADYLNLKKENEKQLKEMAQFANAALIAELIPVYNMFKMAFSHQPKVENKDWQNWAKGMEAIKKLWEDFFKNLGIEEIKTVGEKFDPEFHEAVGTEEIDGEADVVIKEMAPGYTLYGKVIHPAKVVVAKKSGS